MMNEFKFNYAMPREYTDIDSGEVRYSLPKGGDRMRVGTLDEISSIPNANTPKGGCPWCQVFSNGYRVTNDNCDMRDWNGFTFCDFDGKYFYNNVHQFDVNEFQKLFESHAAQYPYYNNFYAIFQSSSKKGFKMLFYWDCDRTKDNFEKCSVLTERYIKEICYSMGSQAKEIVDYSINGQRTIDNCAKSSKQGFYVTNEPISYGLMIDKDEFGECSIEDISVQDTYAISNVISVSTNQHNNIVSISKKSVNKDNLSYMPHHLRRCIYEALIAAYGDREAVEREWEYIAGLMPAGNGHGLEFYKAEPNRNKWYDRYNNSIYHDTSWLKQYGYDIVTKYEYVYINNFIECWQRYYKWHILYKMKQPWIDEYVSNTTGNKKKSTAEAEARDIIAKEYGSKSWNLFDKEFDSMDNIETYRKEYFKKRWNASEFKHLISNYEIGKDVVTYKMYADFYYRDAENLPIINYDILEDQINIYSYWPETGKHQYHVLKYKDEFTHWCNSDTFTNKCAEDKMEAALNKFAPRWFSYHTIRDYLNSLDLSTADPELLETWAIRYFKADDTELNRTQCKNFFIAAVKKQMIDNPQSFVFPHILLLKGPTGCGKTFFLSTMFSIDGHSYILNKVDPNGKDNEIGPMIAKNWMISFGESASLKKADNNTYKEFVDRMNMGFKYQKKYENEQTTVYPRVVMTRTTNEDVIFNDVSINEGDRRTWTIICKCEANICGEEMIDAMEKERDILWATAYKLYLDNPDANLELSPKLFKELNEIQEEYKLIKAEDTKELYDEIFNRDYIVDSKGCMMDEYSFKKMIERSDTILTDTSVVDSFFGNDRSIYNIKQHITRIPARWVNDYVKNKHGYNSLKLLKDYLNQNGWEYKAAGYNGIVVKCWVANK